MSSGNRERGIAKVGPPSFPHSAFREEVNMIQSKQIEPGVLEIRLELHDLEIVLKKASLIDSEQAIKQVHIEPGELIITVVQ
jgi:hypothetical protein